MRASLYRAIWRWHFYAGLLTLPFLVSLALTGGVYLFQSEITGVLYADVVRIPQVGTERLAPSEVVAAATATATATTGDTRGKATAFLPAPTPDSAARVYVEAPDGAALDVFVDPYTGEVLGTLAKGDYGNLPALTFVRRLHSLEVLGWLGNRVIELVAGWTLILVITGIYLWWPRGQSGGVVSVRRRAGSRTCWRDVHAVTGAFAGIVVLFLAATGLPWSGFWGEHFKSAVNDAGWGYPAGFWFPVEQSTVPLGAVVSPTPWALESSPVPESRPGARPIGIDAAVEILERRGIHPGYTLTLPDGPTGVYSASVVPRQVGGARAIHVDQYSGEVLFDARYEDLGAVARAVELGTSIHMGKEFGRANQWLMLLGCVSLVVMAVAAMMMWWKRRPKGALGAPRYPEDYRIPRGILLIAAVPGLVFPLVGLSIVVMLTIDLLLPTRLRERLGC